jgi:hypothetical protein
MTNHFHLVVQTPEPNISKGMQWLNGAYAGAFNRTHKRSGHLFQGRFHGALVETEAYLAEVMRYVVLNPVRAKIVERPEDYEWSSYRATAGLDTAPKWLDLDAAYLNFGLNTEAAQAEYRLFVLAKIGCEDDLWKNVKNSIYLGTEEWAKQMRKVVESKPRSTDHPKVQRAVGRPTMDTIIETVSNIANVSNEVVRTIRGGSHRLLIAWLGWHEGLVTLRSIAASLRLESEGYISTLIRRCELEFSADQQLLADLDAALASMRA